MALIDAEELARIRADLEAFLPDTATVSRKALTPDGGGGQTETWATTATAACDYAPANSQSVRRIAEKVQPYNSLWSVVLPAATDVRQGDRIAVAGMSLEVIAALPQGDLAFAKQVLCGRLEGG